MNALPNVGLIGISGFGRTHFQALEQLQSAGQLSLTCATVINRPKVEASCTILESHGCRIYDDYRKMLDAEAGQIDWCFIPTGIATHADMTIAALRAGSHVYVEKPAAGTLAEVDRMIAARDAAERRVVVGFHDLLLEPVHHVQSAIHSGAIGALKTIQVTACWPRSTAYYRRNEWAGRFKINDSWVYDSPANNALSHFLIAALFFASHEKGNVAQASLIEAALYRVQKIESFDTIGMRVLTSTDVSIEYNVTHSCVKQAAARIKLVGQEGSILWDENRRLISFSNGTEIPMPQNGDIFTTAFSNAIQSCETLGCTLEMAREHTRIIHGLHEHLDITPVGNTYLRTLLKENDTQTAIIEIERVLDECFRSGGIISEQELPWVVPARRFHHKNNMSVAPE